MCLLCGDVIYGGPSNFSMIRTCSCEATAVQPTAERGFVMWDKAKYDAEGFTDGPEIEWTEGYLDPNASYRPQPSEAISSMYEYHMRTVPHDTTN